MGELWRNYTASQAQQRKALKMCETDQRAVLPSAPPPQQPPKKRSKRVSQADLLLALLRVKREQGKPLELPEILNTRIAQFQARLFELRERGHVIQNRLTRVNGQVHSSYWLTHDVDEDAR